MSKCSICKIKINPGEGRIIGIKTLCSDKCYKEYYKQYLKQEKQKVRKEKEKIQIRKIKKKEKKHNSLTYLTKQLDNLWSQLIKINYNYTCQYCGKKENLNSHHLYTRSRRNTRFDLDNGICLCSGCHTLSSNFSAHQTSLEFAERIRELKGDDYINKLSKKSKEIKQWTSQELLEMIESYKIMLQDLQNN